MGQKNQGQPSDSELKWKKEGELWLYLPSGVWFVRKQGQGRKPLFKSTGQTKKGLARARANQLIEEWLSDGKGQKSASQATFGIYAQLALDDWLASPKYREGTKRNMKEYVGELIEELGQTRLVDLTEGYIEGFIQEFRKRKKRTTFRDYVLYIVKVLRYAKRNGITTSVPQYENPDPKKETGRAYTRAEMTRLFTHARRLLAEARAGKNRQILRRRLAMLTQLTGCFYGFLRLRECIQAPWSEIDLETGRWAIPKERVKMGSRTGKGKEIYMPGELLPLLREIKSLQPPGTEFVFPNPKDPSKPVWDNKTAWKELKRLAGIEGRARWHDLRHTALTWALLGDDEFQARLAAATPEEQERMREGLLNPLLVAKYSGTNIRTIESTYLKVRAEHTREVSGCIRI